MPELPEAERIRLTLSQRVLGLRVADARVRRRDVVRGSAAPEALLVGQRIARIERHGKQLALIGDGGGVVRVRLGMTGRLMALDAPPGRAAVRHMHILWTLERSEELRGCDDGAPTTLAFQDARRFGGAHTHADHDSLRQAWASLGPDALTISTTALTANLANSRRAIKAALLDQRTLAGVGNIYADEALFAAGLAPTRCAGALSRSEIRALAGAIRSTLSRAIRAGGSTIRDFADSLNKPGRYQQRHKVYGRGGQPCAACAASLERAVVAQRTTVWCPRCQH